MSYSKLNISLCGDLVFLNKKKKIVLKNEICLQWFTDIIIIKQKTENK